MIINFFKIASYFCSDIMSFIIIDKIFLNSPFKNIKYKVILCTIAIPALSFFSLTYSISLNLLQVLSSILGLFVLFILLPPKGIYEYLFLPLIIIWSSTVAVAFSYLISLFTANSEAQLISSMDGLLKCQIIAILFWLIVYLLHVKIIRPNMTYGLNLKNILILYLGSISSIIMISYGQIYTGVNHVSETQKNILGLSATFFGIIFILVFQWNTLLTYREEQFRSEVEEYKTYIQLQNKQIDSIKNTDQTLRKYRHDMRAHIIACNTLCKQNRFHDLTKYINTVTIDLGLLNTLPTTGNMTVDAILSYFDDKYRKENISTKYNISLPPNPFVTEIDLSSLFYNLLSNAFEACLKCKLKKRTLEVVVYPCMNKLYIKVCNSCNIPDGDSLAKDYAQLSTTKANKKQHGFGVQKINDIVNTYNGSLSYKYKESVFSIEIIM